MGKGYAGSETGREDWLGRGGEDGCRERSGKVQDWARLGGPSGAEKLELEEKLCTIDASRMWGGEKGEGTGVVPFGIKPSRYL